MTTRHEDHYQITRVTRFIPKSFDHVHSRMETSLKPSTKPGPAILSNATSKESFEDYIRSALGPYGFMKFYQIDHGSWIHLYDMNNKHAIRLVFGNPLIAITMIKHDIRAGLFVPIEAYIIGREDGSGTDIIYIKPSTLIAGSEDSSQELKNAAEILDTKLEELLDFVAEQ